MNCKKRCEINSPLKVIHTAPKMTEREQEMMKKKVSNDLYDVFMRIASVLNIESDS
jgi:hypothetical protein